MNNGLDKSVYTLDGKTKIYKSSCRMCHGGCGVLVYVEDGKVVKIRGNPEAPLNKGRMCVKGLASIEQMYNPKRLKYPLKRIGKRGSGKWERISWEEALDTISNKIKELEAEYGIESVALGTGTGRYYFNHVPRFANVLGTPNWCEPGTAQCFIPRILTGVMTYGDLPICDYYGDVNPECVLIWAHNPAVTGADGELQFKLKESIHKGTKLIVVDPREVELAKRADIWLRIRPGTDDALALGMMNVIINEGLYDKEFVDEWTIGFDKLKERVQEYPVERVASITGLDGEQIAKAARMFATSKPATLEWGVGIEQTPNCLQTVRAVALLPGITGNIDVPGGWILGMHVMDELPYLKENLSDETKQKRMGADRFKVLCGPRAMFPAANIPTLFKAMRTGKPYPVKAFLIFGNNGLTTYGNTKKVYETFMSLDFFSVMDIYMTPTAELADIVLPGATWLEADEVLGMPYVAFNVAMAQQKVTTFYEARQPEKVMIDLAKRLGRKVGTEDFEDLLDLQLKRLGMTFDELRQKGFATKSFQYQKYKKHGFRTPSGKVELYSTALERYGYDPLPYYQEPPESPISTPELTREYPLILTTGGRIQQFFNSEYRQIESLRRQHPDPLVEINPETAKQYNIEEGDWVWIETLRGKIKQRARLNDINPKVVNVQHGWWFPEDENPDHGVWKSNANVLTNNEPPYDPAMGTYQLRALLCRISKVEDTEMGG